MSARAPLVSILIDNFNYGRFLGDAIDSALGQSYSNVEVIVVDDGSSDNSREVIAGYGDRIISVLKENGGMASTYNAGFPVSRGEIVIVLDSDDVLLPSAAESAAERMDPSMAKLHWPLLEADERLETNGSLVPSSKLVAGDLRDLVIADGPDAYLSPPTSGNAWSRWFLDRVLPMPELPFRQHADTYLVTLAAVHGMVGAIAAPQGMYRVHGDNDYAAKHFDEKLKRNLAIFEHRCVVLAHALNSLGIEAHADQWMRADKPFGWLARMSETVDVIRSLVAPGSSYLLADGGEWRETRGGGDFIAGRHSIPFTERNGVYWGPPVDDATAIAELESQHARGVDYIVFGWPVFWWLSYYTGFQQHLRDHYRCLHEDDRLVVFELQR